MFETKVIIKNIELQKDILNIMYVTGMDAIEIDNEDVIKITSNYLGWRAQSSIKEGRIELFNYSLDQAVKLLNTSLDMEINDKVIVFIGTLFIVLGGYIESQGQQHYLQALLKHINNLKKKDLLNKSMSLRSQQGDRWDELMNGNAKRYISKFFSKFETSSKGKKAVLN